MLDIQPGDIVAVKTTRGVYRGKSVVLALGPWAAKYLPRLGLTLPLKVYLYFMENFNLLGTYKKKKKTACFKPSIFRHKCIQYKILSLLSGWF